MGGAEYESPTLLAVLLDSQGEVQSIQSRENVVNERSEWDLFTSTTFKLETIISREVYI